MSDQTVLEAKSQSESQNAASNRPASPTETAQNHNVTLVIGTCAFAQIGCFFFLPWVKVLFATMSGFQLQRLNDETKLVWAIPIVALFPIIAGIAKREVAQAARIAGAVPFLAFIFFCVRNGADLFQFLDTGAYITLFLGAALFLLPLCMQKPQS